MRFIFIIVLSQFLTTFGFAANTQTTDVVNTEVITSELNNSEWHLSGEEWSKYKQLMEGPAGLFYKSLSPVEVLGIYADTEEDVEHFAQIYADIEHDRVSRELRFNKAFHDAVQKKFASEPVIKPFNLLPFSPIPHVAHDNQLVKPGDKLSLFINVGQEIDKAKLQRLISLVQLTKGSQLNIYAVGSASLANVDNWAKTYEIPKNLVEANKITLNIENYSHLKWLAKNKSLPYLLLLNSNVATSLNWDNV